MLRLTVFALTGAACLCAADDRLKFDNDLVRVLKVVDQPGRKSALHRHDVNRVMIYLDAGAIDLKHDDGRVEHQRWKPHQVAWSPSGGMHTSENVGKAGSLRIVEIELKTPGPAGGGAKRDATLDPVAIDPKHNVLLLENDQVRVFRSWREAGKSETPHEHTGRGRVVVLLTDIKATVKMANGDAGPALEDKAGEVHWTAGPVKHAGTNAGPKRFDMILVEVK